MIYAQLNEENICIVVSSLSGEVIVENMIQMETYDTSVLGKKYVNGAWELQKPQTPTIPQPTEQELINADTLLNQAEQSAKLNMINETLAVLLLNITGGM